MTREEYEEVIRLVCPHCKMGHSPTYRLQTNEWVHTVLRKDPTFSTMVEHSVCWATGLRTSRFNEFKYEKGA